MILYETRSGWVGTALGLIGAVVIGYFLIQQYVTEYIPTWVFILGIIAVVCWFVAAEWPGRQLPPRLVFGAMIVMTVAGAIGSAPTNGLLIVTAAVGVLRLLGEPRIDVWVGCAVALIAAALVAVGSLTVTMTPLGFISLEGGLALGMLGGLNRRQSRAARERERELIESTIAAREEHARASSLEARQSVARDIHDVLAHSLGGMVVQLDAVEALLESGRIDEAERRIRDARALAASGLGEARRAVDALRSPGEEHGSVEVAAVESSLRELVSAHESMAGSVSFSISGSATAPVPESVALALRRALQESLSNARKHAPGAPVTASLTWMSDRVVLTVSNLLGVWPKVRSNPALDSGGTQLAKTGGGNGLAGMAERFDALPGGAVSAQVREDCFVVRAEAGLK